MASNSPLIVVIFACYEWLRCATGLYLHWIWTSMSLLLTKARLSINEDNAGIGYARIYRALLKKIGGLQLSLNGSLSIA